MRAGSSPAAALPLLATLAAWSAWAATAHALEREHHLGGVVDVGVVVVGELEGPAAGRSCGRATDQSPLLGDLLAEQPLGRPDHRRVLARAARRR